MDWDWTVASGVTLTISNKTINCAEGAQLKVNGDIQVSNSTFQASGSSWDGIRINSSATASTIDRSVIKDVSSSYNAIYLNDAGNTQVTKNDIYDNEYNGIYVNGNSSTPNHPTIQENYIYNNGESGIVVWNYADPTIEKNYIDNNDLHGIYVGSYSEPDIKNNLIEDNYHGVLATYTSPAELSDNTIQSNSYDGVRALYTSHLQGYNPGLNKIINNGNDGIGSYTGCNVNFGPG
jgi:parallel beta-helix repeat protein